MKSILRIHPGVWLSAICLITVSASASEVLWKSNPIQLSPGYSRSLFGTDPVTGKSVTFYEVTNGTEVRRLQMDEIKSGAANGDGPCQLALAHFHDTGVHGISVDSVEAYKWAVLANGAGIAESKHLIKSLDLFMKPKQIELANKAVAEFQAEAKKKKESASKPQSSGNE